MNEKTTVEPSEDGSIKTSATIDFGISLGALAEPISKQIDKYGLKYSKEEITYFQNDIEAYNRLRIRGYITDSVAEKICQKLYNKIRQHVNKANKLKVKK